MQNKLFLSTVLSAILLLCLSGCASKNDNPKPLWASYDTIEGVYPNSAYIARIAASDTKDGAATLAEGELGSYFSHSVRTEVEAREIMTEANVDRSIERTVTIESMHDLFDVHKTQPWFDSEMKQYICCAYINRSNALKLYEGVVRDARNKFRDLYDKATSERDPIKKISLLAACDEPGADFLEKLKITRFIYPGKETAFAGDRKLVEGLELEKEACRMNSVMYVSANNDEGGRLVRCLSQIISAEGFIVTENRADAVYEVLIDLDFGKFVHGETITAEPGLSVVIRPVVRKGQSGEGSEKLTYKRNLPKQTGFAAAESLINRKIIASAEEELNASLPKEFKRNIVANSRI